jgi:hypothetical protein
MAICSCCFPARCCQPAGGVIYSDLWGELNTYLALQAFLTQSSPVHKPLLQAFHFPSILGEVTLHLLSLTCVFVYTSHGRWVFPTLLWSFPPSTTLTSFPAPGYWVCATRLIYSPGKDSLAPSLALSTPHPLSRVSLLFLLLITQFLFFPWLEVGLSRGLC